MRGRMLILVLAILLVAGFAYQNWAEITRRTTLDFGVLQADAPMGLILLTLLGLTLLMYLASSAAMHSRSLHESRQHTKQLNAQRELAEKAEASRFTDLRQLLDNHLRQEREREHVVQTELDRTMAQHQRELRNQLEQMYHLLTSRLSEMERRFDSRGGHGDHTVDHVPPARVVESSPLHPVPGRANDPGVAAHVPPGRERV